MLNGDQSGLSRRQAPPPPDRYFFTRSASPPDRHGMLWGDDGGINTFGSIRRSAGSESNHVFVPEFAACDWTNFGLEYAKLQSDRLDDDTTSVSDEKHSLSCDFIV